MFITTTLISFTCILSVFATPILNNLEKQVDNLHKILKKCQNSFILDSAEWGASPIRKILNHFGHNHLNVF